MYWSHVPSFLIFLLYVIHLSSPTLCSTLPSSASHRRPSAVPFPSRIRQATEASRRPWTRLRDRVIQYIFSVTPIGYTATAGDKRVHSKESSSVGRVPANLLARYGGDVVLRFNITTVAEAKALAQATNDLFLDVWEFNDGWVDIRLAKDVIPSLLALLPASLNDAHTPLMHDLAQSIFESYPSTALNLKGSSASQERHAFSPALRTTTGNLFFRDYQPLSVIIPWHRLLASLFPTHVRMFNIGTSYEARGIPALRVGVRPSTTQDSSPSKRKTIVISGGSHAREWISTSSVNYVAYSLITLYGKSPEITKLVESFDWVFVPTLNVDGYVYTWETDRLWRKNRQQTFLRFCQGVDLDRSWGFEWDGDIKGGNPCSESFPGDGPFEAVESRRFAEWAKNETSSGAAEFVGFLDLHSYSQQVLYPYSFSCAQAPPSLENLQECAIGLAKAIRLRSGEVYGVSSACEGSVAPVDSRDKEKDKRAFTRMERGGGSALDWFYHEMNVKYAFQIKLRDTGSYGFLLPKDNIIPTGEEAFGAVAYFGKFLLGNKGIERKDEDEISPVESSIIAENPDISKDSENNRGPEHEVWDSRDWELRRRRRR